MRIEKYNYQHFQDVITPSADKSVYVHKLRGCEYGLNVMSVFDTSGESLTSLRQGMGAVMFSTVAPEIRAFLTALFCASSRLSMHGVAHAILAYKAACVDYLKYLRINQQPLESLTKTERYLHLPHKIDHALINCVRKTPADSILHGRAEPNHPFDHINERGSEGYLNRLRYFISRLHEFHETDLSIIEGIFQRRFPRKNAFFEALANVSHHGYAHHFVLSWFEEGDTSLRPIRLGVDALQLSSLRHLWLMSQRTIIIDCMTDIAEAVDQGAEPYRLEALLEYYRALICEGLADPINALIEKDMMLDERVQVIHTLFKGEGWLSSPHIQSGLYRYIERELRKHSKPRFNAPMSQKTFFVTNHHPREDQLH
jgi:hypothetical protein